MLRCSCFGLGLLASCGGGSNDGTSVTVSAPAGGSVSSDDGLLTLDVPPGALEADTQISIRTVSSDDLPDGLAEGVEGSVAYRLEPDGLTFSKPVIATLRLDQEGLASPDQEGAFEVPLLFIQAEGADPELLGNLDFALSLDEGPASISGELEHFSWIKQGKGPVFVNLEYPDDPKPIGLPFKVRFNYFVSVVEIGFDECKDCQPTSTVELRAVEKVTVISINGRPGTSAPPVAAPGAGGENQTAELVCVSPGTGSYNLYIVYDHHIDWTMSFTGTVKCVFTTPTPTPTPTPTTIVLVDPTTTLPTPTATPTNIVLIDPTTTLPTPGPTVTPGPAESSGCDIRVDTSRQGYVSTAEGDRMNVQMDLSHGSGGPAGGISATVEIDKAGNMSHAGATTNNLGQINFLVLDGPPGPHSLELVDLRDQTGTQCTLLPGSTTSAAWSVAPGGPGEMFFDCVHFDGYSEIIITGVGFSPNQILFGEVFGPVVFGDGSLEVQAGPDGSFILVIEIGETGDYFIALGPEETIFTCD